MYNLPIQEIVVDKFYTLLWAMPEYDRPTILYARGNTSLLREVRTVAFTGTRNPTPGGLARTKAVAQFFAENGVVIVSGGCHGIDTAAHEGALTGGGQTIVVLPHSLNPDDIKEEKNEELFNQIIMTNGLLITEYKTGNAYAEGPTKRFFARNRIIAGLGRIVIPGQLRKMNSGTGATIEKGEEYGRYIMVPKPDPGEPRHDGARELLKRIKKSGFTDKSHDNMLEKLEELAVILPQPKYIAELNNVSELPKSIVFNLTQEYTKNTYKIENIKSIVANIDIGLNHYWIVKLDKQFGGYYCATEVQSDGIHNYMGIEPIQCANFIKDEEVRKHLIAQIRGVVPIGGCATIQKPINRKAFTIHLASFSNRANHHGPVHLIVTKVMNEADKKYNLPMFAPDKEYVFGHKKYDALIEIEQAQTKSAKEKAQEALVKFGWNKPVNDAEFRENYYALLNQRAKEIDEWLIEQYNDNSISECTLCCYCGKDKRFCHVHLLAEWLIQRIEYLEIAIQIQEY
jgi:DNA processing protein